jgi:alpha-methylacyl-CoA racemase
MQALHGVLVLDLTRLLPGAVATQVLAAFGARVIKIEQPGTGDYARHGFSEPGENPIFAATNQGKESVVLDLKSPEGIAILHRMAESADVLIESFRPGVMDRLGCGYSHLRQRNPRLIYVALTGYGQSGQQCQTAGHDINYLAMSGVLDVIGTPECPVVPGVQLADLAGGSMQVLIGALIALQSRERTSEGQFVDVSMTHGVRSLLPIPQSAFDSSGRLPRRGQELLSGRFACYGVYPAAEGFVAVGALEPKFWANLCKELERPEWIPLQFADDGQTQADLKSALTAIFVTRGAEDWFALLGDKDCCVTPVRNLATAIGTDKPPAPWLSATPADWSLRSAPRLGEHTESVLTEFLGDKKLR